VNGKTARFTRVEIVKALSIGRGQGFALEGLSPAINIIHGPNGSGKSTLSRVMQKLLWPKAPEVEPTLATATLAGAVEITDALATRVCKIEVEAGHVTSTIEGASELPPVGSPDLHARYRMPITELLVDDNHDFAREILRQAAGGFDLERIAAQAGFASSPATPRALQRERREAAGLVKAALDKQAELERSRADLDAKRSRQKEVAVRILAMDDLTRAKEHLTALQEQAKCQAAHNAFDVGVRKLSGGEAKELEELEEAGRTAQSALASHEQELANLEDQINRVGATELGLAADFPGIEAALETLRSAEQQARSDEKAATQDAAVLSQASSALFDREQADQAGTIDQAALKAADALFEEALAVRAMQKEFDAEKERLALLPAADGSLPDAAVLARGIEALGNWLRAPAPPSDTSEPFPLGKLGVICGILAAASLVAAALVHWGLAAGAMVAVALFGAAAWLSPRSQHQRLAAPTDAASVHRETYARLHLPEPEQWSVEPVVQALGRLVEQRERRSAQDAACQARLAHEQRRARLQEMNGKLADHSEAFERSFKIGAGSTDKAWICLVVQRVNIWQDAARRHQASQAAAVGSATALSDARQACLVLLNAAGVYLSDAAQLTFDLASSHAGDLREKHRRWHDLNGERSRLKRKAPVLIQARDQATANLAAFWRRLGLAEADTAGLARLLEAWRRLAKVENELTVATLRVEQTRRQLGSAEGLLARGLPAIESDLAAASGLKEELDQLNKDVAKVEAQLEQASQGHDVSLRLEALAATNARLLWQEELNADLAVGRALVEWLREQAHAALAPPVLKRAQSLLTRFTNGRLAFQVEDAGAGGPQLVAANGHEARRPVAELSSGERVQLLMAVRLAFLEESEELALPLLLDEVLASSDDDRTVSIIETVIEIARTGRQVFYFTAQADEVGKWRACLGAAGVDYKVVDLRAVRSMAEVVARPLPPPAPSRPALPLPNSCSHREYGDLLKVPAVDPWEPELDNMHIWHVIEDVPLLHKILSAHIERLGPLERLVKNSGYAGLGDARDSVLAVGSAFRAACRAWRIGRGKALTRELLSEAAGVSDVFFERVLNLSQEVGHDGKRLLQELEAGRLKGWREKSSQELRDHLAGEGCFDEANPLGPEQIREAVLGELSRTNLAERVTASTLDRVIASLPA
jgi:DNA repair protein SbcC/Rad50